jgi:hypothetical protein
MAPGKGVIFCEIEPGFNYSAAGNTNNGTAI